MIQNKILVGVVGAFAVACGSHHHTTQLKSDVSLKGDHPAYIVKKADPGQYTYEKFLESQTDHGETLCGSSDLTYVDQWSRVDTSAMVNKRKRAVGAVSTKSGQKYCTGTMISMTLFLTADHCVVRDMTDNYVVFNYEKDRNGQSKREDRFEIQEVVEENIGVDVAILRPKGRPGGLYGYTPIRSTVPKGNSDVVIIQHPKGQSKQVDSGRVVGDSRTYLRYVVDTLGGSSGAGVLNNQGYLVGIHTNGGCSSFGGANRGVSVLAASSRSSTIKQLLGKGEVEELSKVGLVSPKSDGPFLNEQILWDIKQTSHEGAYSIEKHEPLDDGIYLRANEDGTLTLDMSATQLDALWEIKNYGPSLYSVRTKGKFGRVWLGEQQGRYFLSDSLQILKIETF